MATDGGQTWTQVLAGVPYQYLGPSNGATDLVMDPANHNIIFAGLSNGFVSGQDTVYESQLNGVLNSWTPVTCMPDNGNIRRVGLGMSQDGSRIYAALADSSSGYLENQGIYVIAVAPDGSTSCTLKPVTLPSMYQSNGLWWYDSVVAVDPTNANIAYAGGIDLWRTTDGGANWSDESNGVVHGDQHALAFMSTTSESFYLGTDGGVWSGNYAPLTTGWTNLNGGGLNITQFYGGGINGSCCANAQLYGASQDNGIDQYPLVNISGPQTWNELNAGGDGLQAVVGSSNSQLYVEEYGGNPTQGILYSKNGGSSFSTSLDYANTSANIPVDFVSPLVRSPNVTKYDEMLLGLDQVYRTTKSGSWVKLSNYSFSAIISSLAVAPGDDNRIYVGTTNGTIFATSNAGVSWTPAAIPPGEKLSEPNSVTGLAVDPNGENTIYATYSGFGSDCPAGGAGCEHVFKSADGGTTWTDISATLPNAPFESIIDIHPPTASCLTCQYLTALVAASDVGVFVSSDSGTTWSQLGFNLPYTEVDQVFADPTGANIYAATHGRGMWTISLVNTGSGTVYAAHAESSSAAYLYSLNGHTGTQNWQTQYLNSFGGNIPVESSGMVYINGVYNNVGSVLAYNEHTGGIVWHYDVDTNDVAVANGTVYAGQVGVNLPALDALNGATGSLLWSYSTGQGVNVPLGIPLVDGNGVYVGSIGCTTCGGRDAGGGYLYAVNASTGTLLWSVRPAGHDGIIRSAPAVAKGVLYVTFSDSTGSYLFALNETNGAVLWDTFVGIDGDFESPAVANGLVYVTGGTQGDATNNNVLAFNASTGALAWEFAMSGSNSAKTTPAIANGIVYVGSADDNLYALNATTGVLLWSYLTGGVVGNPVFASDTIYVGSADSYLYAINASFSTLEWRIQLPTQSSAAGGGTNIGVGP